MKIYSTAINNYRAAQRGFWQRNFFTFVVRDKSTGAAVTYNLWDGDDNVTVQVVNQNTGALEYRDYFGGGQIVSVNPIVRSEGTGVRNISVRLSGASPQVLDMVQGYDCRDAVFEWHIGEAEESTGILVDTPDCEFDGFVDTIDLSDGAVDPNGGQAESNFDVSGSTYMTTLLRTNPAVRSKEFGNDRSGDGILSHSDAANQWTMLWGKKGRSKNGGSDGDGRDKPSNPNPVYGHR